jgi:hypothetical protein
MKPTDLQYPVFSQVHLKYYEHRAADFSGKFLRWFLEHIFRLDPQDADEAAVDAKHDKGVDAIFVDDVSEAIYVIQAKTQSNAKSTLGDTDLKSFVGTLVQFDSPEAVAQLLSETKNERLKQTIERQSVLDKMKSGYNIEPVFITNVPANNDATTYLTKGTAKNIALYDCYRIADEYIDLDVDGGINADFYFDVSDSDVIAYDAGVAPTRIFLAPALNLLKMDGISDGRLFEQNVRLSLGNTKVNRGLRESIRAKKEHSNFPLYHNGINVLCEKIVGEGDGKVSIKNYVVVNGAQSLTSLMMEKSKISDDLKILVKLIEVKGNTALSQKITRNSNNQNAIKARDLKSNHNIQQRIKAEVNAASGGVSAYEIKQGEDNKGKRIISNESAGLVLLAMDLEQPWNCHQKYKIMDDLHSDIFGRPGVTGGRVLALWDSFQAISEALDELENTAFAYYTLTKYFLAYAVSRIIKDSAVGAELMSTLDTLPATKVSQFVAVFAELAKATANDLNAEIAGEDDETFDYKNELKSAKWCRQTAARLLAQYKKDVQRKKAESIESLFSDLL